MEEKMIGRALILLGGILLFCCVADAQEDRPYRPNNTIEETLGTRCAERGIQASIRQVPGREIVVLLCHDQATAEPIWNYLMRNGYERPGPRQGEYSYSLGALGCWKWSDSGGENIACAVLRGPY
jgi:hypothetical protein